MVASSLLIGLKNARTTFALLLIFSFAGCGLVYDMMSFSSGVLPMGPDTFSVSADDGNPSKAKRLALGQAQEHCKAMGKEILVTNTRAAEDGRGYRTVYDVTFRCLSKDDPSLVRPTYEKSPDVRIEDRRK